MLAALPAQLTQRARSANEASLSTQVMPPIPKGLTRGWGPADQGPAAAPEAFTLCSGPSGSLGTRLATGCSVSWDKNLS